MNRWTSVAALVALLEVLTLALSSQEALSPPGAGAEIVWSRRGTYQNVAMLGGASQEILVWTEPGQQVLRLDPGGRGLGTVAPNLSLAQWFRVRHVSGDLPFGPESLMSDEEKGAVFRHPVSAIALLTLDGEPGLDCVASYRGDEGVFDMRDGSMRVLERVSAAVIWLDEARVVVTGKSVTCYRIREVAAAEEDG